MTRPPTWLRGFLPVVALQTQALKVAGVQPQGSPTPVKGNDVVHRRGRCEDTSTLHESDMDPSLATRASAVATSLLLSQIQSPCRARRTLPGCCMHSTLPPSTRGSAAAYNVSTRIEA